MFLDLFNFMESRKNDPTLGFAHAPILWAHQHERHAKHDRDMSTCELGNWGLRHNEVRTITWKGMPWICRREWFLDKVRGLGGYGALSQHRISWGGGDMHIGIKPWLLGFKNWAVPTSPGIHIGPFPREIEQSKNPKLAPTLARDRYRLYSTSGNGPHTIGFLISCYVLGGEPMMERNKKTIMEKFGKYIDVKKWWPTAIKLGQEEKAWLDSKKVITFEQLLQTTPWDAK